MRGVREKTSMNFPVVFGLEVVVMACRFRGLLYRIAIGNHNNINKKNGALYLNAMFYHISEEAEEEVLPQEWYWKAFTKIRRLSQSLENVDLVNGRLVDTNNGSTIRDEAVENRMHTFKSLVRGYMGSASVQKTLRRNSEIFLNYKGAGRDCETLFSPFSKPSERKPLVVDSLTKISNVLNVTAQQRKVVRQTVCHQVTQQRILIGSLENILTGLKFDLDSTAVECSSKCRHMSKQIVHNCLKFLSENAVPDPEYTQWIRLAPAKTANSSNSRKWEDFLQMFNDLIEYLTSETRFQMHLVKLKVMKEGLAQIKDILVGSGIGYKEGRHQEYLVQKKLSKTLGHSSRCLFTLLLCYLYDSTMDFEVDICGGIYQSGPDDKSCLYFGKILTSGDEKMGQLGVRQLDKALRLFKFIWEIAGMKGCLEIQGHLFYVGADTRLLQYRGNVFILHGMGD